MSTEHLIQLSFEGEGPISILCREDEDVITAALRQNLLLLSDCRAGTCGTCRAYLQEGEARPLLEYSPHALSEREAEEGWVLACRLRPASALALDFDYPSDRVARFELGSRRAQVMELERRGSSVIRLVVRTLSAQEPLSWQPGQYVRLELEAGGAARAYSMANLPSATRELEFFIKLLPGGQFSRQLASMPGPGATLSILGPFGSFALRAGDAAPVFVAGGTGLAPILALLRELAARRPAARAALLFGVGDESEAFARSELAELRLRLPELETILACAHASAASTSAAERIEQGSAVDALARYLAADPERAARSYYLCGPPAMLSSAGELLERLGVPANRVHQEAFTPSELSPSQESVT